MWHRERRHFTPYTVGLIKLFPKTAVGPGREALPGASVGAVFTVIVAQGASTSPHNSDL